HGGLAPARSTDGSCGVPPGWGSTARSISRAGRGARSIGPGRRPPAAKQDATRWPVRVEPRSRHSRATGDYSAAPPNATREVRLSWPEWLGRGEGIWGDVLRSSSPRGRRCPRPGEEVVGISRPMVVERLGAGRSPASLPSPPPELSPFDEEGST